MVMASDDHPNSLQASKESTLVVVRRISFIRTAALLLVKKWWKHTVVAITPILLLFLPLFWTESRQASWTAYAVAIIVVYWITEVVPLAVTALLPIVLFPAVGVLNADDTASSYYNDINMLSMASLIVAVAIEKWNVHKRIALLVLLVVGSKPKWVMLGFMCTSAFLSMWMSNSATTAMMLPIAKSVLMGIHHNQVTRPLSQPGTEETTNENTSSRQYIRMADNSTSTSEEEPTNGGENGESCPTTAPQVDDSSEPIQSGSFKRLTKGLYISIAYSASIGSTATLTGSASVRIFAGDVLNLFPQSPGISFGQWFAFATPTMIVCLLTAWAYLSFIFCDDCFGCCKLKLLKTNDSEFSNSNARNVIRQQYRALGSWSFAEIAVMCCFVILALLWLLREPKVIPGWGEVFQKDSSGRSYFTDSSTAIFIVFLMFLIPSKLTCCRPDTSHDDKHPYLLDWKTVQVNLQWSVILLQGSGFAIAKAANTSGLSCWMGEHLHGLGNLPIPLIVLFLTALVVFVTEFVSNSATSTLLLPILANLAVSLGINPLYLMIPASIAASYAFMLPVATPPNAIVFAYGNLKVYDMALTGIVMNIICVLILNLSINVLAVPIFDLHSFPNWSNITDFTNRQCFNINASNI